MLWYSLEAPHRGASNVYPQHMYSWTNKENTLPFLILSYALSQSLRKQAYSNILNILPPKNENFQIKIRIFFLVLLKT